MDYSVVKWLPVAWDIVGEQGNNDMCTVRTLRRNEPYPSGERERERERDRNGYPGQIGRFALLFLFSPVWKDVHYLGSCGRGVSTICKLRMHNVDKLYSCTATLKNCFAT